MGTGENVHSSCSSSNSTPRNFFSIMSRKAMTTPNEPRCGSCAVLRATPCFHVRRHLHLLPRSFDPSGCARFSVLLSLFVLPSGEGGQCCCETTSHPVVVGTAQNPRGAGIVAGQRGRRVANCSCVAAKAFAAALFWGASRHQILPGMRMLCKCTPQARVADATSTVDAPSTWSALARPGRRAL